MIWPDRSAPTSCLFFKTDPNKRIPQECIPANRPSEADRSRQRIRSYNSGNKKPPDGGFLFVDLYPAEDWRVPEIPDERFQFDLELVTVVVFVNESCLQRVGQRFVELNRFDGSRLQAEQRKELPFHRTVLRFQSVSMVFVTMNSLRPEFFRRSIAGPESTPCAQAAITSFAPFS